MTGEKGSTMRKINFGKLSFSGDTISTREALRDVTPISWPQSVYDGTTKVIVSHRNGEKKEK